MLHWMDQTSSMYTNHIVSHSSHVLEIQSSHLSAFKWHLHHLSNYFSLRILWLQLLAPLMDSCIRLCAFTLTGFIPWLLLTSKRKPSFQRQRLFSGIKKPRSSLCISSRISIDGTVHQADFDSHARFDAMTLPDHFLSHGCCCNSPLYPLSNPHLHY